MSVWVKLCTSKDDENPTVFPVDDFSGTVDQLKKRIKKDHPNSLSHVDASYLHVYPKQHEDGGSVPWEKGIESMSPRRELVQEDLPGTCVVVINRPLLIYYCTQ